MPEPLGSALRQSVFQTGDAELDDLLETARRKMLLPNVGEHRDALEKLWDAWERLKTIEDSDKAKGAAIMLDKVAGTSQPDLSDLLEEEAKALTGAGNKLRIRHSENEPGTLGDIATGRLPVSAYVFADIPSSSTQPGRVG